MIPFVNPTVGVVVFAAASILKDAVNRIGDLMDDGKHVSPSRLADLLSWKHSGFHIDGGGEDPVPPHDADGRILVLES